MALDGLLRRMGSTRMLARREVGGMLALVLALGVLAAPPAQAPLFADPACAQLGTLSPDEHCDVGGAFARIRSEVGAIRIVAPPIGGVPGLLLGNVLGRAVVQRDTPTPPAELTRRVTVDQAEARQPHPGPIERPLEPLVLGPTIEMLRRASDDDLPPPPDATPEQARFILVAAAAARESQRSTGVPASVAIAQAILESDWGGSRLAAENNNFFGIKGDRRPGSAGVVWYDTWEYFNGRDVVVKAPFRAYARPADSFVDHGRFFLDNSRYGQALEVRADPQQFAREINAAGYATDPEYAPKLIRLMDRFNLYQYDLQ